MSPPTHSVIEFIFLQLLRYMPYKFRKLFIILSLFFIISSLSIFILCVCVCLSVIGTCMKVRGHFGIGLLPVHGSQGSDSGWQNRQQHIYLMSHLVIPLCYFLSKHIKSFSFPLEKYSQEKTKTEMPLFIIIFSIYQI